MQQIIISGLGGQGILFITKLLAETALNMGHSVLISETHGMAQRGGNVVSHLKVFSRSGSDRQTESQDISGGQQLPKPENRGFTSPLIRPGKADVLLALHPDAPAVHGFFLKPGGRVFCNARAGSAKDTVDAERIACELGSAVSANVAFLGFAAGMGAFFCPPEQLEETIKQFGGKRLEISLGAFKAGWNEAARRNQ
ncbi:MAG: 2-oxoacid:acceptor oxidoreductase family protein [Syntrophobacteraceae bacterium]